MQHALVFREIDENLPNNCFMSRMIANILLVTEYSVSYNLYSRNFKITKF